MAPPFSKLEYNNRMARVKAVMKSKNLDGLLIGNPNNINWLTGYDAWSFYTPQMMLLDLSDNGVYWFGRDMDAGAAKFTTYLTSKQLIGYPEEFVQRSDIHPSDYISNWIKKSGYDSSTIGIETDSY